MSEHENCIEAMRELERENAQLRECTVFDHRGRPVGSLVTLEGVAVEVLRSLLTNESIASFENVVTGIGGTIHDEIAVSAVRIARRFIEELRRG